MLIVALTIKPISELKFLMNIHLDLNGHLPLMIILNMFLLVLLMFFGLNVVIKLVLELDSLKLKSMEPNGIKLLEKLQLSLLVITIKYGNSITTKSN